MRRGAPIVFFFAALLAVCSASAQQVQEPDTYGPSAFADHAMRIEKSAVEYLKANPIGLSFVDLDVYISGDKAEFEALGKYVVLVFATFSQDKTELPLDKVYSGGVPIKCLKPIWRDVPPNSATAKANGRFRSDSLCVLPIHLARRSDSISVDYSKNKKALEVASHSLKNHSFIKSDQSSYSPPSPDPVVLRKIIDREYPGFGFEVPS